MCRTSYFDASGKGLDFPALTVAGAISTVESWGVFIDKWSAILASENVSEFHATDFFSSLGEFKDWRGDKQRRTTFMGNLLSVIASHCELLFSITVEREAWQSVNAEYFLEEAFHSPFALAGVSAVLQASKWTSENHPECPVKVVFEDGEDSDDWIGLRKLCGNWKIEPIRLPKPMAIPCQVGDLVAWKGRITSTNALIKLQQIEQATEPDLQGFEELRKELDSMWKLLPVACRPGVYGPEALLRTCKDSSIPKRSQITISPSEV